MLLVAEGRRHHPAGRMIPVGIGIFALVERQVLDQRFAIDTHAFGAGAADRLVCLFAGGVDDIDRAAGHVGDHDGAVGGFTFHFGRAGIGMRLGAVIALGEQLCRHRGDDVAVFGVHQRQSAEFGAALEGGEHLVIVYHQRALVGHEVLEGVDALVADDGLHLLEDLLAPPGDRHVEGIIAIGAGRFVVPHGQRLEQRLAGGGQGEIDHHRRAAGKGGARAAFEIVGGIGAHEGHFEMRVRIDAARHDVTAGRIQRLVAREVRPDLDDLAAVDLDVGFVGEVGSDDGAVFDDCAHSPNSLWLRGACASWLSNDWR